MADLLGLPSVVPAVAGSGFFVSAVPVPAPVWLVLAGLGTVLPLVPAVLVLPLPALVVGIVPTVSAVDFPVPTGWIPACRLALSVLLGSARKGKK